MLTIQQVICVRPITYGVCPKNLMLPFNVLQISNKEDRNYNYYRRIQEHEIRESLKRMSNSKLVGLDNIPIEVGKSLGDRGIVLLTKLFNEIMRTKKMLDEWRRSTLIPIYKNKGDIQNFANYRRVKLMSHTMKVWDKVIERRLRKETRVTNTNLVLCLGG